MQRVGHARQGDLFAIKQEVRFAAGMSIRLILRSSRTVRRGSFESAVCTVGKPDVGGSIASMLVLKRLRGVLIFQIVAHSGWWRLARGLRDGGAMSRENCTRAIVRWEEDNNKRRIGGGRKATEGIDEHCEGMSLIGFAISISCLL